MGGFLIVVELAQGGSVTNGATPFNSSVGVTYTHLLHSEVC